MSLLLAELTNGHGNHKIQHAERVSQIVGPLGTKLDELLVKKIGGHYIYHGKTTKPCNHALVRLYIRIHYIIEVCHIYSA